MEGCLGKTLKYLLIISNNCVILIGVVVLGFSVFALTDGQDLAKLVQRGSGSDLTVSIYGTASTVLIVVSVMVIIIAFLGCCGAMKENRCMLFSHYVVLLALLVGLVIGATLVYSQSLYIIRKPLKDSMTMYDPMSDQPDKVETTEAWDDIQQSYWCCGVYGYTDWARTNGTIFPKPDGFDNGTQTVPDSCCSSADNDGGPGSMKECLTNPGDPRYAPYMDGCLRVLDAKFSANKRNIGIVSGVIVTFIFVNLVSLFCFAMCLDHKRGYQRV